MTATRTLAYDILGSACVLGPLVVLLASYVASEPTFTFTVNSNAFGEAWLEVLMFIGGIIWTTEKLGNSIRTYRKLRG